MPRLGHALKPTACNQDRARKPSLILRGSWHDSLPRLPPVITTVLKVPRLTPWSPDSNISRQMVIYLQLGSAFGKTQSRECNRVAPNEPAVGCCALQYKRSHTRCATPQPQRSCGAAAAAVSARNGAGTAPCTHSAAIRVKATLHPHCCCCCFTARCRHWALHT
jgi:hypothetical protein